MKRRTLLPALAALPALPRAAAAQTAEWVPDRPIRLVVGFAAGGSTDTTGRLMGQALTAAFGTPAVVENRVGAAGNIATEYVARSTPDGYTMVVASMGSQAVNAALYRNLSFDPVRDFVAVSLFVKRSNMLVAHPSVPAQNLAEFVAYARANPGRVNVGIAAEATPAVTVKVRISRRVSMNCAPAEVTARGGKIVQKA